MATDTDHTFDVIVIGLGPGGEHVAGSLAERGLRVLGVDRRLVGGECPYWGCIPSKMMIRAADALAEARRVDGLAGSVGDVMPDWSVVATRIREEATDDWDDRVAVERLTGKGATFVRGTARIAGPGRVDVDGTAYTATTGIVVNTGTTAAIPPVDGLADTPYWTNHDIVEATELPGSIVVLGGGAIGCELSQVMARFGVDVTVVEAADRIVALEEPEASDHLESALEADGITVRVGVGAEKVTHDGSTFTVTLADGSTLAAEKLLVATGRRADPAAVGLDTVGVAKDSRTAPVDDRCRVADGVWAVGDITGKGAFTHVSMYQAGVVIRDVLGDDGPPAEYAALPRVTFTDPEVGAVGMTEAQAREKLANVQVGVTPLGETTRGWIAKADGLIKVVADADRGVLVGATTMGPAGGEVLGALAVAVHGEVPIERLRSMIYAYPTLHRGIEDALGRLA
ncbi:pyridine nucleotide-disulfide oxidoreductase [Terrabacter sp. Soil811]|uniref:dihydrolipoyl dehydrogenase family protein n=1 Tax=Terrabacter sp. Soil811 TaxID=1736419 RepID=UPI0006FAC176|nr:NAD(P)/FAD-dependent oxidoreductase [Terrabacter sp. Soil811]KRF45766.1 pyridine nucleotide-disulfide oxidoreductase [Terrabacter sp. Soil811]